MTGLLTRTRPAGDVPWLICFHHAGGGAGAFASWQKSLGEGIHVCPVRLPGRESRFRDARLTRLADVVDAVVAELAGLGDTRFVIFGHSMGSLIGYAVTQRLLADGRRPPEALIAAAYPAPDRPSPMSGRPSGSDEELAGALAAVGGLPPSVAGHPELLSLLLPIVRDDLAICRGAEHEPEMAVWLTRPLPVPVHVVAADRDPLAPPGAMAGWRRHAAGEFTLHRVEGGHFAVRDRPEPMIRLVTEILNTKGTADGGSTHRNGDPGATGTRLADSDRLPRPR